MFTLVIVLALAAVLGRFAYNVAPELRDALSWLLDTGYTPLQLAAMGILAALVGVAPVAIGVAVAGVLLP